MVLDTQIHVLHEKQLRNLLWKPKVTCFEHQKIELQLSKNSIVYGIDCTKRSPANFACNSSLIFLVIFSEYKRIN